MASASPKYPKGFDSMFDYCDYLMGDAQEEYWDEITALFEDIFGTGLKPKEDVELDDFLSEIQKRMPGLRLCEFKHIPTQTVMVCLDEPPILTEKSSMSHRLPPTRPRRHSLDSVGLK